MAECGDKVRIILSGNFHYSGLVIDKTDSHLTIRDKFGSSVLIKINDISVMEVLSNGK